LCLSFSLPKRALIAYFLAGAEPTAAFVSVRPQAHNEGTFVQQPGSRQQLRGKVVLEAGKVRENIESIGCTTMVYFSMIDIASEQNIVKDKHAKLVENLPKREKQH